MANRPNQQKFGGTQSKDRFFLEITSKIEESWGFQPGDLLFIWRSQDLQKIMGFRPEDFFWPPNHVFNI